MRNEPDPIQTQNKRVEQNDASKNRGKHNENALDEALKESFPASDPIAINVEKLQTIQPEKRGVILGDKLQ